MRKIVILLVAVGFFSKTGFAWDQLDPNFPRQDTPYVQMVSATVAIVGPSVVYSYAQDLGYFFITAQAVPFSTLLYNGYFTGSPTGNSAPVRATLALMDDAAQPFPILFPDWAPGGAWMPGSALFQNAALNLPALQIQYEQFMSVPNSYIASPAVLNNDNPVGTLSVSVGAPGVVAPFPVTCAKGPGFQQSLALYSAYGNAVESFVPVTLQDDGPFPVKDERAWPLPYDLCD